MIRADMFRVSAGAAGVLIACLGLSGCVGSPTYGTDKTAAEQLVDDIGSMAAIGTNPNKGGDIKQNPRPDLVMPPATAKADLVAPQPTLASRDNPEWVESPEETRQRLVAEADANKDNPKYRSPLLTGYGSNGTMTETQKWEAFRDARKIQKGAYLDQRRFLSEPPTEYRQAGDPAVLDNLGEPEEKKDKRRKKEAKAASQTSSWWKPFQ